VKISFISREKQRLRVSEIIMLTKIFGSEGEEVAGGRRKLHTEEFHHSYFSPNIVRVIKSGKIR
jgi:hypothetical protein